MGTGLLLGKISCGQGSQHKAWQYIALCCLATAPPVLILHQPCAPPSLSPPPLSCYSRVKSGQVSQFCERECGELRRVRESPGCAVTSSTPRQVSGLLPLTPWRI